MKPFSQACENNKGPILAILREVFADRALVLEIGSGTGQHAVHFATHLTHLTWQPSDQLHYLAGIRLWVDEARLLNLPAPIALDVNDPGWPIDEVDAMFSANTAHIMDWPSVERMFEGIGRVLVSGGVFVLYGPFNYAGHYTSMSNMRFDASLRDRDPASGIRDFEAVNRLAVAQAMQLEKDYAMPANNRALQWRKA